MVTFISWRTAIGNGERLSSLARVGRLYRINHVPLGIVILIPFIASAMARALLS